jgi:predicted dinucleotide-binding enzyme
MKIGVIGAGNMGRALGLGWAQAGHEVLFGSRDPVRAKDAAAGGTGSSRSGDLDEAAAFGDVILYTVRGTFPSQLLRDPRALSGKAVLDCNNSDIVGLDVPSPKPDPAGIRFVPPVPSLAERLAADIPAAHVVKAFNTVPATVIALGRRTLVPQRVSVFLCSDDPRAKSAARELAEQLGFVAVDSGGLEQARLVESVADFIRFQIIAMGLGPYATISVNLVQPS